MKALILTPTYNERENIEKLLDSLIEEFTKIKDYEMHVLVIDDNSPDGTAEFVKEFSKKYENVHLITGGKEGLGRAYARGFKWALNNNYDILFMMDADLSHDPKLIHEFLRQIEDGYDFVIGSRYVQGGATPDWNFSRKLISRSGNLIARIFGGMYSVHDCTSGYRAFGSNLIKNIDLDRLNAKGYAFLENLLYLIYFSSARIKEIPITFRDRKYGESKLGNKDFFEFVISLFLLRAKYSKRFYKFCTVGFSGVFVNMFFLWFLTEAVGVYYLISSIIAIEISIINNFTWNNFWTFKELGSKSSTIVKFIKYNIVSVGSLVINFTALFLLTEVFGIFYLVSNLIGIVCGMLWNYFVNLNWTWSK